MPNEDQRKSAHDGNARGLILPGALIALVIVGVVLVVAREDEPGATSPTLTSSLAATTATTSTSFRSVSRRLERGMQVSSMMCIAANAHVSVQGELRSLVSRERTSYGKVGRSRLRFNPPRS